MNTSKIYDSTAQLVPGYLRVKVTFHQEPGEYIMYAPAEFVGIVNGYSSLGDAARYVDGKTNMQINSFSLI